MHRVPQPVCLQLVGCLLLSTFTADGQPTTNRPLLRFDSADAPPNMQLTDAQAEIRSHGIDCVRMLEFTPIDERDAWFLDPPWQQPEFAEFLRPSGHALMGHYAGRAPRVFSFNGANLRRKYQDQPTTGRVLDEENYQIGFVDIVDTPYPEIITASRALGQDLYRLRFQQ